MSNNITILNTKINVGDTISVYHKIMESGKERIQIFNGILIAIKKSSSSFIVRKIGPGGIGVEKIWPINSPLLTKIVVKKKGNTRRAKIYYLRERIGKEALRVKAGEAANEETNNRQAG